MQPTSLDVERATILARKALENRGNYVDVAVEIIPDLTEEVERGWGFFISLQNILEQIDFLNNWLEMLLFLL